MIMALLNGENPYQVPAEFIPNEEKDPLGLGQFERIRGESPCFTNMADCDSIIYALCSLAESFNVHYGKVPYLAVAAKHGNPCGIAVDWSSPEKAIKGALWGHPLAIWGGEMIVNFPITSELGKLLFSSEKRKKEFGSGAWMLDVAVAPDFAKEAIEILGKRKERKLLKNWALTDPILSKAQSSYRYVRGGILKQPPPNYVLDLSKCQADKPIPRGSILDSLIVAWAGAFCSFHGGNEMAFSKDRKLIGVGGGPSTIDATRTALIRAKENRHDAEGSVFAADAFFPFTDVPEVLSKAGCQYGVVPAGGKRFEEIRTFFKSRSLLTYFIPEGYRGFYRH